MTEAGGGAAGLVYGRFVTANEINGALTNFQNNVNNQINQAISSVNNGAKDGEQDGRLGTHDAQIQDLYNRDGNQAGQIGNLTNVYNNQQNMINNLSAQITNINNINAAQQAQLEDYGARLTKAEQNITSLDGRVTEHDKTLAAHNATLSSQSATLTNHSTRIGQAESDISGLNGKTTTTNNVVGQQGSQIGKQGTIIANQGAQLADQGSQIADQGNQIGTQGSQISNLEVKAAVTDDQIADMNTTLANHGATLSDHENRIITNESDIAAIKNTGVFYTTDATGKKTGGIVFNDGTGNAVQLSNVAAGKQASDAVNVSQLSTAVSALGGGARMNSDGTMTGPSYLVGGQSYTTVGDALRATNEIGVQYVVDGNGKRTDDIILTGTGKGPVAIHNLADGKVASDAATVRQVSQAKDEAMAYTDTRVSELSSAASSQFSSMAGEIASTRKEARGGIASAMALAAMRYDTTPGKAAITAGFGSFMGDSAISAGIGYTSQDGKWRWNAGLSRNFGTGDFGVNAGISMTMD